MFIVYEKKDREIRVFARRCQMEGYLVEKFRDDDRRLWRELYGSDLLAVNAEFEKEDIEIDGVLWGDPFCV